MVNRRMGMFLVIALLFAAPAYADPAGTGAPDAVAVTQPPQAEPHQQAQPLDGSGGPDRITGKYLVGYLTDTGKMLSSPLHWDREDWLKLGVVGGVTGGLFLVDRNVKNFAQSHHNSVAGKFATLGNDLGNPLYTLPPMGAFYLYGVIDDDSKARKTSLLALESYAISGIFTNGLKALVQRHRPNTGDSPGTIDGPKLSLKNLSFCSGHTSSAFSIATVFAEQYKDSAVIPPLAYGLATLTGLSRVYSNAHWASDAFFGAALGYFTAKAVLKYHPDSKKESSLSVAPVVGKEMKGLAVNYSF